MRDYLNYTRTVRFSFTNRMRFRYAFMLFVTYFIIMGIYFNGNGFSFDFFTIFSISAIGVMIALRNRNEQINLTTLYPISYKKRVLYNTIYTLYSAIVAFIIAFIIFGVLIGLVYLVTPQNFTFDPDSTEVLLLTKGIYYDALHVSFISFILMSTYIKDNKKWISTISLGTIILWIIQILVVSIYSGRLAFKGIIPELFIENPSSHWWMYVLSSILFASSLVFLYLAFRLRKPKASKSLSV